MVNLFLLFSISLGPSHCDNLIKNMSSPSYKTRHRAYIQCSKLPVSCLKRLEKEAKNNNDLETRHRCKQIARNMENRILDCFEPYPMIDALWMTDKCNYIWDPDDLTNPPQLVKEYIRWHPVLATETCGDWGGMPWANYRTACRKVFTEKLREGASIRELSLLWLELHRRDYWWFKANDGCQLGAPRGMPFGVPALRPVKAVKEVKEWWQT